VNLLLLLSALLSALTGVGGARGTPAPRAVCARSVEVCAARATTALVAIRPMQALPGPGGSRAGTGTALVLAAAVPLFASRRRE
jgi:hypothetical protein